LDGSDATRAALFPSPREAFSFALARKLLPHYEATPLHMDVRAVLDKIAESLEGDISIEPDLC
jgi:hypothetical protein